MATYEIVGPDGRTYEIEAPSQEAAIAAFQSFAIPSGGVTTSPGAVADLENRMGAAARGFADLPTFGMSDEIAALMASTGGMVPDLTFGDALGQARAQIASDVENYPGARLTGQIGGGVVGGLALGGPLDDMIRAFFPRLAGSGPAARIGRGAIAGGIEGTGYGLGSGEGAIGRLEEGVQGGLMGAAAGGIVPAAIEGANMAVLRPIGGALGIGNERRASNALLRTLEDAGMTPDEINVSLQQAAGEGQTPFTIADVLGVPGRRTLAGTTTLPGPARVLAESVLEPRQVSQTERLAQYVNEALQSGDTRAQAEAAARLARGAGADINYGAARENAQPVDVGSVIKMIDERIGPMADTTIRGEGLDNVLDSFRRRMVGTVTEEGEDLPAQLSDLSRLGRLYSEMGDAADAAARAGRNFEAGQIRDVRRALGNSLETASPDWRAANAEFAAASRVVDAPLAGESSAVRTVRSADVADRFADIERQINAIPGLTDAQRSQFIDEARQGFRIGYANRDLTNIEAAGDARNMARALFSNDRQRANYGLLATDPELFFRRVGREDVMSQTRGAALGGSQTAANLADQAMVEGADVDLIANLATGRVGAASSQIAGRALQAARGGNEQTREMIARALLSNDTVALARLLQPAQRGVAQSRMVETGLRGGLRGLLGQD
jgi:hypothetical protein